MRGLATATWVAVAETVRKIPGQQKADLSTIRRFATAYSTTFRARCGLPLPDPKPAAKMRRTPKSNAIAVYIGEDECQANPVLIKKGLEPVGVVLPKLASSRSTASYATAFAHASRAPGCRDHQMVELDISQRDRGGALPHVALPTDEEACHAATIASMDSSAYMCWLCRTCVQPIYACLFLFPEQHMFTANRNYCYQMENRPGMRNLPWQSA